MLLNQLKPSNLGLSHPTSDEEVIIWNSTAAPWSDTLPLPVYLEESAYMKTAPLAKNGGLTLWILVDKSLPPGKRRIFSSCETFQKQALSSRADGKVAEVKVHGIASVYTPLKHRGCGYAKEMMRELAAELYNWGKPDTECIGSILYSDIGKGYYASLGWLPAPSNTHIELQPYPHMMSSVVRHIYKSDLETLCDRDEVMLRAKLALPTTDVNMRMAILPNIHHMGWHRAKEEFACQHLFGKIPEARGAITGPPGSQTWAIWTRRYYNQPEDNESHNVLYILRLVIEADETATRLPSDAGKIPTGASYEEQLSQLKNVLQSAQKEAFDWKLGVIQLWDPTPMVRHMLERMGVNYKYIERDQEGIASSMWYDGKGGVDQSAPLWVDNEHYAWM